jgi:hypothetical protein
LAKVPNCPCLFRHKTNGTYYGIKTRGGKSKEHPPDTVDGKLAERKLKEWISSLDKIDAQTQRTTLKELLEKFQDTRAARPHR